MNHLSTSAAVRIWIGDGLRSYHVLHPGSLVEWRTEANWLKLLEWNVPLGEEAPALLKHSLVEFLRANNNRPGSDNPWSIAHRTVKLLVRSRDGKTMGYSIAEYSIGRVRTREQQIAFEEDLAKCEAEREVAGAIDLDLADLYDPAPALSNGERNRPPGRVLTFDLEDEELDPS